MLKSVDWDAVAKELKQEQVVDVDLWGLSLLCSCIFIRSTLEDKGIDNVRLNILDGDETIRVSLGVIDKEPKKRVKKQATVRTPRKPSPTKRSLRAKLL